MVGVLVGRDGERSTLRSWLAESTAGTPRVVLISGEPGTGKSRLLEDFLDEARAHGVSAANGRAVEQEGAPPFWPWRLVLRELEAPELLGQLAAGDATSRRFALFEDITRWIANFASDHDGLVIGLDDVHCADLPSIRLLSHLATGLRADPVMLAVTHRPATGRDPRLGPLLDDLVGLPARRSLVLRNLDRTAVAELLGHHATSETVERVHDLTGGNPLFATELARQLDTGSSVDEIPESLRALVGERMVDLTAPCAQMLRGASVIGREFTAAVLAGSLSYPILDALALLDEAIGAGMVRPTHDPGRFSFTHLLVRDIVESTVPIHDLPLLHRRAAEAIELYEGSGDDHVHEIARHWDHAAVLGDADIAATWAERAADAADRALAWEEALRLYERSLALSPAGATPEIRHRRLLGAARCLLHSQLVERAVSRCAEAADAAHEADRPDLAADAALLIEGRGGSGGAEVTTVIDIAEQALEQVDPLDHTRRARLLGLLTALYFYVDASRCEALSMRAVEEAARSGAPQAIVAAARARQMVRFGPEHAEERLELAREIGGAGRILRDPSVTQWEPLWRIDALLELGRVHEAAAELPSLRRLAESTGHPMSRWHCMRSEAVIAAATGRWDDARRFGAAARSILAAQESFEAAVTLELALQTTIGMHVGYPPDVLDDHDAIDVTRAPAYVDDVPTIVPLLAKLALGRRTEAGLDHSRLPPVSGWTPPRFLWLPIHTMRLLAAIELDRRDELPPILERLASHRGRHVAGGGGPIAYFGSVELYLGHGALELGDLDTAVTDLRLAVGAAASASTPPFEVRAATLLVRALQERARPGDPQEAATIARRYQPIAAAFGMAPSHDRLERALTHGSSAARHPLSAREQEVAGLVARGMTNNEIAAELHISARTAQNHVQHILTKLGLSNRTQIATWHHGFHDRAPSDEVEESP